MAIYSTLITSLGVLALVAVALSLALAATMATRGGRDRLHGTLLGLERHVIGWAWGVATIAMLGSLYLSEIANFLPCLFCWYQRIAMYPLVVVLGVGALRSDPGVWRYALPLPVIGFLIAAYHVTIQWRPTTRRRLVRHRRTLHGSLRRRFRATSRSRRWRAPRSCSSRRFSLWCAHSSVRKRSRP